MTGTVVVHAEPPLIALRKGWYWVVIDGVRVGGVKQGGTARFPVPAGTHTVRISAWDRTRSNAVTVEVGEDREFLVTGRGTGSRWVLLVPSLAHYAMIPWYCIAAVMLPMYAALWAVPGLMFRVRAVGDSALPSAEPARPAEPADPAGKEHGGNGLWWESDPALAKRFRKNTAS
ncbi:hypothetical protein ACIG5E_37865 [Kitasatospora sp. NPDC053057]|uniref:hypothetical protein n=1 Tax=Kitasatospora sp. NPDC053057 TaxID=3364062 RepID=UPI0037C596B9